MENCFVKKLKDTFNNSSLSPIGNLKVPFVSGVSTSLIAKNSYIKVYNSSNVLIQENLNKLEGFSAEYDGYILVEKYKISSVGFAKLDMSNFKAKDFEYVPITEGFSIGRSGFSDSVENMIQYIPNMTSLGCESCNVTGSLDSLLDANQDLVLALTYINVRYNSNLSSKRSTINRLNTLLGSSNVKVDGINIIEDV